MDKTISILTDEIKDIHDRYVKVLAWGNRNEKARASTTLDESACMMVRIAEKLDLDKDEVLGRCGFDVEQWNNRYKVSGKPNKYRK